MISEMPTLDKVQPIVADVMQIPLGYVTPASSPDTIETWDSLRHLNLVLALEESFGVQFSPEEIEQMKRPILEKYEHEGSPYFSTARIWDDGILDPLETREALALGISMSLNAPIPDYKVGLFRM